MFLQSGGETEIDNAWRTYAAAENTGMAAPAMHDEIRALRQMAAEIAGEMVRREAGLFDEEDEA